MYDREKSLEEIERTFRSEHVSLEERYEKVTRIFAFWSVYLSHAGLARYLNQDHSIRALEHLADQYEGEATKTEKGHTPFNFTLVQMVARLYNAGKIDRTAIEGWGSKVWRTQRHYGVTQNGITHVRVLHAPIYRRQTIRISKTAIAPSKDRSSENESN
jgi:hypothetical protein